MANFKGTIMTERGRNLLAKALTGATLQFTKVQIGDGVWDTNTNPEQMTFLVSPKIDLPIQDLSVQGDGTARIRVALTNTGLQEGFFTRELGIFAKDLDTGNDILYAVSYADSPDFIPSDEVTKIEDVFDIYAVVSNAQSVTAEISDTVILATKRDIEKHNQNPDAHQDIRQEISGIKNGSITVANADKVDGKDASDLANVDLSNITALGKLLDLDGKGSGLDADFVRGFVPDRGWSNIVNITNVNSPINLEVGQTAYVEASNTNSVPLRVKMEENSIYKIIGIYSGSVSDLHILPNHTSYSNQFSVDRISTPAPSNTNNNGIADHLSSQNDWYTDSFSFDIGTGVKETGIGFFNFYAFYMDSQHKKLMAGYDGISDYGFNVSQAVWNNTSDAWNELGTFTSHDNNFDFVKILIKRLK